VWRVVARGNWRPLAEAQAFVRPFGLKGKEEYESWAQTDQRPADIPAKPQRAYAKSGWKSWTDFLGTKNRRKNVVWRPYAEAEAFVRRFGLKRREEYRAWAQRPSDIPAKPEHEYAKSGWKSWTDFLGTNNRRNNVVWRPSAEAKVFVRSLGLKSKAEWREFPTEKRPADIPARPDRKYAHDGWTNWPDWLGTDTPPKTSFGVRPPKRVITCAASASKHRGPGHVAAQIE
jgi:hypothetical protein